MPFSSLARIPYIPGSLKLWAAQRIPWAYGAALLLSVAAFARPQLCVSDASVRTFGIDIMLALDCSTSMLAHDFTLDGVRASRIAIVKRVVENFIKKRNSDRIGIVVFSGRAYLQCPLTTDYAALLDFLNRIEAGMIEDGTAIGDGIGLAVKRLKDIEAPSKVVILLTDGRNNAGTVDPLAAAQAAAAFGIKVYTIGAGSLGTVPYPVQDVFGNTVFQPVQIDIDDTLLEKIAQATGARYFRAQDTESLKNGYEEIDRLEKTKREETRNMEYYEIFQFFLVPAMFLAIAAQAAQWSFLRVLP